MPRRHTTALLALLVLLAGCAGGGATSQPPAPSATVAQPTGAPPAPSATAEPPAATPSPAAPPAAGAALKLRVGESGAAGQLTVTLVAVENDSRCPTQVSCVWEGAVEAVVEVVAAGQGAERLTLTLAGQNRETEGSRAEAAGHTIRLTALDPYPADTQGIAQGDYVATLVVEEARAAYAAVGDGSFEGVIVPERDAAGLGLGAQSYWTPAEADVLALEAGLEPFLRAAAPPASTELWRKQATYKRQYAGLVRDGRRLVYASFFCSTGGEEWRRQVLFVLDGGDCFFQLTYDVERGAYGDLMVNGDA